MAFTASEVIDRARVLLKDTGGIRYTDAQFIYWINDACKQLVVMKPDASSTLSTITLATGTEQSIPADGHRLLSVLHNMSAASGGTAGRSVRVVSREVLDTQEADWNNPSVAGFGAHGTTIKNYHFDEQTPRVFHVFPGVSGNAYLRIAYSKIPTAVTLVGDNVDLPDIYSPAILDYILYRAYQHDAESDTNVMKGDKHYAMFVTSITGKTQVDNITTPNRKRDN